MEEMRGNFQSKRAFEVVNTAPAMSDNLTCFNLQKCFYRLLQVSESNCHGGTLRH
jgi:hypothetical protein